VISVIFGFSQNPADLGDSGVGCHVAGLAWPSRLSVGFFYSGTVSGLEMSPKGMKKLGFRFRPIFCRHSVVSLTGRLKGPQKISKEQQ
jgi:hypothetical protein